MAKPALILFAHGARDPQWAAPFVRLRDLTQLRAPDARVTLAYLELMAPTLPQQAAELVQAGCTRITVVPVFLGQGGHVKRDLPLMMEELKARYPGVELKVALAVGEDAQVQDAIAGYCAALAELT
jgi:sirohydrochlorin cobaltochelatase